MIPTLFYNEIKMQSFHLKANLWMNQSKEQQYIEIRQVLHPAKRVTFALKNVHQSSVSSTKIMLASCMAGQVLLVLKGLRFITK
jgi:hypothetical protein